MENENTSSLENDESKEENQLPENVLPSPEKQLILDTKADVDEEEIRRTLELIASTGRFWMQIFSFKREVLDDQFLMYQFDEFTLQVIYEYPEASMNDDQQIFAIGETIPELVNRLDSEVLKFADGAPFTLQRICEILLAPKGIYPKLLKLVLALEKNLLVTSTFPISIDTPPAFMSNTEEPNSLEPEKESETASSLQEDVAIVNGVEAAEEVKDEISHH